VNPRVEVFIGPFGSGKTEVALNRALALARGGTSISFIDLDLVDPFFRAREARAALHAARVRVVAPSEEWNDVDLPLLTPEVFAALAGDEHVVIDAGGEVPGALVLRQLLHLLPADTAVYLVVNPYRPFMRAPERIAAVRDALEDAAGWHVTALIANPHLSLATTPQVVEAGFEIVAEASARMGLPIAWTAVAAGLLSSIDLPGTVLPLVFHMLPPWEREVA